jgi:hypothetical protein
MFADRFPKFLYLSVLEALLSDELSPLPTKFKNEIQRKHKLNAKKIQEESSKIQNRISIVKVQHGGSEKTLNRQEELLFLATYNRYLFVIKNARKEKRRLKKLKRADFAESEVITKYNIPENLKNSTFSDNLPSDVALDWAKDFIKTDLDEATLKRLLTKIRNKQKVKEPFIIIDADFTHGTRIYAVRPDDKQRLEKISYLPLEKPPDQKLGLHDPDSFLVSVSIY